MPDIERLKQRAEQIGAEELVFRAPDRTLEFAIERPWRDDDGFGFSGFRTAILFNQDRIWTGDLHETAQQAHDDAVEHLTSRLAALMGGL